MSSAIPRRTRIPSTSVACDEWTGSIVRDIVVYPESEPCNTLEDLNPKYFSDMLSVQVRAVSNGTVVDV